MSQRNNPLLVAFTQHPNNTTLVVDITDIESAQLSYTHSAAIQHLKNGNIAQATWRSLLPSAVESCGHHLVGLFLLQRGRKSSLGFGRAQSRRGVVFDETGLLCPGEERPGRGGASSQAGARSTSLLLARQPRTNIAQRSFGQIINPISVQEHQQRLGIANVGQLRALGHTTFGSQVVGIPCQGLLKAARERGGFVGHVARLAGQKAAGKSARDRLGPTT